MLLLHDLQNEPLDNATMEKVGESNKPTERLEDGPETARERWSKHAFSEQKLFYMKQALFVQSLCTRDAIYFCLTDETTL